MTKLKVVTGMIFILGLWYLIIPSPTSINRFSGLPGAVKSGEPGDTWQNPNIAAYYSNYRRDYVTEFYKKDFQKAHCQGFLIINPFCLLPPIKLNHPPEYAYVYIRDQQSSTYLEEYIYPFKDSLLINGYEPYDLEGKPFNKKSYPLIVDNQFFDTKVTLRSYGSNVFVRVIIYILVWVGIVWMYMLTKRILKKNG